MTESLVIDLDATSSEALFHLAARRQMWEQRHLAELRGIAEDLLGRFGFGYAVGIADVVELRCLRAGLPYDLAVRAVLRPLFAHISQTEMAV